MQTIKIALSASNSSLYSWLIGLFKVLKSSEVSLVPCFDSHTIIDLLLLNTIIVEEVGSGFI